MEEDICQSTATHTCACTAFRHTRHEHTQREKWSGRGEAHWRAGSIGVGKSCRGSVPGMLILGKSGQGCWAEILGWEGHWLGHGMLQTIFVRHLDLEGCRDQTNKKGKLLCEEGCRGWCEVSQERKCASEMPKMLTVHAEKDEKVTQTHCMFSALTWLRQEHYELSASLGCMWALNKIIIKKSPDQQLMW